MIIDHINNTLKHVDKLPRLQQIFKFIENLNPDNLEAGRNEIDGDNLWVMFEDTTNRPAEEAQLEAHKKYGDLHFTISGSEKMGYRPTNECSIVNTPYNEQDDYILYGDEPTVFEDIPPKHFCIVFPGDAHMPMIGKGRIKKLVFKIKI